MNLFNNRVLNYSLQIRAYRKVEDDGKKKRRKDSSSNQGKLCQITQRTEGSDGLVILQLALAEPANGGDTVQSATAGCVSQSRNTHSSFSKRSTGVLLRAVNPSFTQILLIKWGKDGAKEKRWRMQEERLNVKENPIFNHCTLAMVFISRLTSPTHDVISLGSDRLCQS